MRARVTERDQRVVVRAHRGRAGTVAVDRRDLQLGAQVVARDDVAQEVDRVGSGGVGTTAHCGAEQIGARG